MGTTKPEHAFRVKKAPPKHLHDFAKNLETALNASLPSKLHPYDKVSVLAFHWQNDNMGVIQLETQLLALFRDAYGYNTESYVIPTIQSVAMLTLKLTNWSLANSGQRTLRIYVYSGHAANASPMDKSYYLGGRANPNTGALVGPTLDWYTTRNASESLDGDMCYIMDCCSAGSAALNYAAQSGPEILCSSGWEQPTAADLQSSFTKVLVDILRDLNGESCTIADIQSRMLRNARQNVLSNNPIHVQKQGASGSITLGKLGGTIERRQTRTEHRVLLSVRIQDNAPDYQAWERWLSANMPRGLMSADVRIESAFESTSTVILVTIPFEIWTMLPEDDPAFTFVSFVKSNNILPDRSAAQAPALPLRPSPGPSSSENHPPSHRYRKSLG